MNALVDFIINLFGSFTALKFGKEIIVFVISMLPILELRGGLLASALLNIKPLEAYIICIVGNLLPIPFVLLFINSILNWMSNSKIKCFNRFCKWLFSKVEKNKSSIEKYGYYGLILFVGIPLPGTGAWTGSLVASVLSLDKKKSFICILLGIILASVIMMLLSYGLLDSLIH